MGHADKTILVSGATGRQGGALLKYLLGTFLREAKALFSQKVLKHVELKGLERLPFEGISTGERLSMR
jgi:hypothetical protein